MSERNLLTPPEIVDVDRERELIFLNGPIQGAPDWQTNAIRRLRKPQKNIVIASPRKEYGEGEFVYEAQVDWETHYRQIAHRAGVNLFWLAAQIEETPGRAYAQTSRVELGESMAYNKFRGSHVVVGIEEGFGNARYIRRRIEQDTTIPVFDTLEETCQSALRMQTMRDIGDLLHEFSED